MKDVNWLKNMLNTIEDFNDQYQGKKVFCMISSAERFDELFENVKSMTDVVDRIVVICNNISTNRWTERQLKLLHELGAETYEREWDGSFPNARNEYLLKCQYGDWIIVFDTDEHPDITFRNNFSDIIQRMIKEKKVYGRINSHDITYPYDYDYFTHGSIPESISDHMKVLLFKYLPGMHYEGVGAHGTVHEILMPPPDTQFIFDLPRVFYYVHIKREQDVWKRALRNVVLCFPPYASLLTDHGLKNISEITKNDLLMGYGIDNINELHKHEYIDNLIEINGLGILPFQVTKDHPIAIKNVGYTVINSKWERTLFTTEWVDAKNITIENLISKPSYNNKGKYLIFPKFNVFHEVTELSLKEFYIKSGRKSKNQQNQIQAINDKDHFLKIQQNDKYLEKIPLNEDIAELLGGYLAEGTTNNSGACFCYDSEESEYVYNLKERIKSFFPYNLSITTNVERRTCILTIGGSMFGRFIKYHFGGKQINRRIPQFIMYSNHNIVKAFLKGYFFGDGYTKKDRYDNEGILKEKSHLIYTTSSKTIAIQLQLLYSKLNVFATIEHNKREGFVIIKGRESYVHDRYQIHVRNNNYHRKYLEDENNFYLPILTIKEIPYNGFVYNLSTDTNIIRISNILTHNCGGGNNVGGEPDPKNPNRLYNKEWEPLLTIMDTLGLKNYQELDDYLKVGQIDESLKDWIIRNRKEGWDFEHEMTDIFRYYFYWLHPEEKPADIDIIPIQPGSIYEIVQFVEQEYIRVLGRHADDGGKYHYAKLIQDQKLKREDLEKVFKDSPEYKQQHMKQELIQNPQQEQVAEELTIAGIPVQVNVQLSEKVVDQILRHSKFYTDYIAYLAELGKRWLIHAAINHKIESQGKGSDEQPKESYKHYADDIVKAFPPLAYPRLLDIGAGAGDETSILQDQGYEVVGLTLGEDNVKSALQRYNIHLLEEDMHCLRFPKGYFDAAVMIHTYEHSYAPFVLLGELYHVLRDGARVYVAVPDPEAKASQTIWHVNLKLRWQIIYEFMYWGFLLQDNEFASNERDGYTFVFEKLAPGHALFTNYGYLQHIIALREKI